MANKLRIFRLAFAFLIVLALLMIPQGSVSSEVYANGNLLDTAAAQQVCTLDYRFQVQFSGNLVRILLGQQGPGTDCPEVSLRSGNGGTGEANIATPYPFALIASGTVTIPWNSPTAGDPDRIIGGTFSWTAENLTYAAPVPAPDGNQKWRFRLFDSTGTEVSSADGSCLPGGACGSFDWTYVDSSAQPGGQTPYFRGEDVLEHMDWMIGEWRGTILNEYSDSDVTLLETGDRYEETTFQKEVGEFSFTVGPLVEVGLDEVGDPRYVFPIEGSGTVQISRHKTRSGTPADYFQGDCDQTESVTVNFELDGSSSVAVVAGYQLVTHHGIYIDGVPGIELYTKEVPDYYDVAGECISFIFSNFEAPVRLNPWRWYLVKGITDDTKLLGLYGPGITDSLEGYTSEFKFDSERGVATYNVEHRDQSSSSPGFVSGYGILSGHIRDSLDREELIISKVGYEKPAALKPSGHAIPADPTLVVLVAYSQNYLDTNLEFFPPEELLKAIREDLKSLSPEDREAVMSSIRMPDTEKVEPITSPREKTNVVEVTEKLVWPEAHSSIVPVPDLTQKQIDFVNSEMKAEEARLERFRNPTFLQALYDGFQTSVELYDLDFEWAPGLNVQISSRPEDIAIWGAEVVAAPGAAKVKGKIRAFLLSKEAQEAISDTLTVVSTAERWYEIRQPPEEEMRLSGVYFIGPFTVRVTYAPELIPDGFSEEDLGMVHTFIKDGEFVFNSVRNILVDKESRTVSGKVDHFSVITVGVQKEPVGAQTRPDYLLIVLVALGLGGVAAIVVMARRRKKRVVTGKTPS